MSAHPPDSKDVEGRVKVKVMLLYFISIRGVGFRKKIIWGKVLLLRMLC